MTERQKNVMMGVAAVLFAVLLFALVFVALRAGAEGSMEGSGSAASVRWVDAGGEVHYTKVAVDGREYLIFRTQVWKEASIAVVEVSR